MSDNAARKINNPFDHDAPERTPQNGALARVPAANVRRTGIIALCIGASRILPGPDRIKRQYEARELRVEAARAQRDGRELNVSVLCFETRRIYPTFEEFAADCPSAEDMRNNDEAFTWAYWCEDKYDPRGVENATALGAEVKALKNAHKACTDQIAKLADVEQIMKERKRADEIKKMIDDATAKKKAEEDNIIGLLSETPYAK